MKKIFQYTLMAVALVATASCSNELDETLQPVGNGNLQFVVSDFPAFDEGAATRAVGTPDAGKTAWADGDEILVHLHSPKYGDQAATLQFKNGVWGFAKEGTLTYLDKEEPTITAVYAPDCEIKSNNTIGLKEGKQYGMAEYILANASIKYNTLNISFTGVSRTYSRLRIVTMTNVSLTVTTTDFTPAGPADATAPVSYSFKADDKGNAYLYGTFADKANLIIKHNGEDTLREYDFTEDTKENTSYALFAGTIVDLSTLSATYEITDNMSYLFKGAGKHGIKVTRGRPSIFLDNAIVNVTDGNAISITDGVHVTVYVSGAENKMTSSNNTAVAVSGGATFMLKGYVRDKDVLTAIGGSNNNYTANGTAGAGIGSPARVTSDSDFSDGDIIIENMTVHATGGEVLSIAGGAGIGSSSNGKCGDIIIQQATVIAQGGNYAAAIGLGCNAVAQPSAPSIGKLDIRFCDITATGGNEAAAIGFCRSNTKTGSGTYNAGKILIFTDDSHEAFLSKLQTQGSTINKIKAQRIGVGSYDKDLPPTLKNTNNDKEWEGVEFNTTAYPNGID